MAGLIFDKAQIEQTIDAVVARTMRMDMTWDWPCGVAYYGICEAYEVTGKQEYLKLVQDRVDEYIELGLPEWTVNTCSMGHCLITLYEHTGDERYLNIAKSKVDYLENKALRFGDRVLQHTVSVNNDFPEQAWADTLFMAAFFLLRMGVLLKDAALIDDALNQYYWHIKYLQDPATGLYYHGYNNLTDPLDEIPLGTWTTIDLGTTVLVARKIDPFKTYTVEDLDSMYDLLTSMKSDAIQDELYAAGAALDHNLNSAAMNTYSASKIKKNV